MFEVGWTEMLVIAIVMIVVVGPKDLPNMLRTFGRMAAKLRGMANDFQKQFNEALKEAELDDVKKSIDSLRGLNPTTEIRKQLNPFEKAGADLRAGIDQTMKPKPKPADTVVAADATAESVDPLKNGATALPGVSGPDAMSATSAFPAMTEASVTAAASVATSSGAIQKPSAAAKKASKAAGTASTEAARKVTAKASSTSGRGKSVSAKVAPAPGKAAVKSTPVKMTAKPEAAVETGAKAGKPKPAAKAGKKPARAAK